MMEGCQDSEAEFVDFANLGCSLIVQGGYRDNTAAAVSFVIQPDGIFVAGRHCCVPFPSFRVLQTDKGLFSARHSVSKSPFEER
jgi:hypothetical protein